MNFLKELLAAVGGAVGIVIIILIFARGLLQKWFENIFDISSQKAVLRFSNVLQKNTSAYEILLNKEFLYYENASKYISNLVVDIQDFYSYIINQYNQHENENLEKAKSVLLKILSSIPEFKGETLIFQNFIPMEIFESSNALLGDLQNDINFMFESLKNACSTPVSKETDEKLEEVSDKTLFNCANVMMQIKKRLKELTDNK